MTLFIDIPTLRSLINEIGEEGFVLRLSEYILADFLRWNQFEKSARVANYFTDGVIELMPTSDGKLYSFKYVTGHPKNTLKNQLTVMAFGMLADVASGVPLLLAEFTLCTAFRTAATSALVAKALARPDSNVMALIGCGAQSEFQAIAFKAIVGIEQIQIFDVDPLAMDKFLRNTDSMDIRVVRTSSLEEAVKGADIITLATAEKIHARFLTGELTKAGVHINAIGGDCPGKTELHAELLSDAKVFVEFEPQTRIEGDIQQMSPDFKVTEVWQVFSGESPGRERPEDVTVFDSVGFALEDFSTLRYLYDLARDLNVGTQIDLIAEPANPKDLYRLLQP
jgi:ornithine cyclodeaminase